MPYIKEEDKITTIAIKKKTRNLIYRLAQKDDVNMRKLIEKLVDDYVMLQKHNRELINKLN